MPELVPVIKEVQKRAGLKPDGVIGPRTVASLAGTSKADRIDKVVFALEELRWLPSDLGSPRVFINEPAFTASYIEGGEEKLKMRVVVGKPTNQTSFFYDEIEQVDYNPYWGVPQSILVNEMLPRLRRDPGYLDRAGYEVSDSKGRRIPSSAVNWGAYGSKIPVRRAAVAERGQCARRAEDPVPQQARHLHARHAAEGAVQAGHARLQPWLRAAGGSARHGRGGARHVGRLYRREAQAGPFVGKGDAQDPGLRRLFHGVADDVGQGRIFRRRLRPRRASEDGDREDRSGARAGDRNDRDDRDHAEVKPEARAPSRQSCHRRQRSRKARALRPAISQ